MQGVHVAEPLHCLLHELSARAAVGNVFSLPLFRGAKEHLAHVLAADLLDCSVPVRARAIKECKLTATHSQIRRVREQLHSCESK